MALTITPLYLSFDSNTVFTPEQDNDKTNVELLHSYDAFHTRSGNDKTDLV